MFPFEPSLESMQVLNLDWYSPAAATATRRRAASGVAGVYFTPLSPLVMGGSVSPAPPSCISAILRVAAVAWEGGVLTHHPKSITLCDGARQMGKIEGRWAAAAAMTMEIWRWAKGGEGIEGSPQTSALWGEGRRGAYGISDARFPGFWAVVPRQGSTAAV